MTSGAEPVEPSKEQFEYEAFWNEWVRLKQKFADENSLSDIDRSSLADVITWAAEDPIESVLRPALQIFEATDPAHPSSGASLLPAAENERLLVSDLAMACIQARPYEMSVKEAKRFVKIYNAQTAPPRKIHWRESLRPVVSQATVEIVRIERMKNSTLEDAFELYVESTVFNSLPTVDFIAAEARAGIQGVLGAGRGHFLFHGTSKAGVQGIGEHGLDPKRCNITRDFVGQRFGSLGQGAYLSDNFAKCAAYARCETCDAVTCDCDSARPVLVCLVRYTDQDRVKDAKTLKRRYRDTEKLARQQKEKGEATTVARGNPSRSAFAKTFDTEFGNNDFLVYRSDMALPMFVVWYKRKPGR